MIERCGLTISEVAALQEDDYDLDYFITMLVNEHNNVSDLYNQSTAIGKLVEMRQKLILHAQATRVDRYDSYEDIPRPLLATLKSTSKWESVYLRQMLSLSLLPDLPWETILQVFHRFGEFSLLGQKAPKKLPDKTPIPAFAPFLKLVTRSPQFVDHILQMVLQNQIKINEIGPRTNNNVMLENLEAHVCRFLSWDFEEDEWKYGRQLNLAELQAQYPDSKLAKHPGQLLVPLLASVLKLSNEDKNAVAKAPLKLKTDRPPKKNLMRQWNSLPDIVRMFVNNLANNLNPPRNEAAAAPLTLMSIQNPRGALDVQAKFVISDVRNSNVTWGVEYNAAHLQLPLALSDYDIKEIVSNVISGGDEDRLVVKVWCNTPEEEEVVRKAMLSNTSCKNIQRHYWWISQPPSAPIPRYSAANDVLCAIVGHFSTLPQPTFVTNAKSETGRDHRSSVVYAPQIPHLKLSRDPSTGKSCEEEMNLAVPLDFIKQHTNESDWVADFLCGSGSAAVAAIVSGRNCLVVDILPEMVTSLPHVLSCQHMKTL